MPVAYRSNPDPQKQGWGHRCKRYCCKEELHYQRYSQSSRSLNVINCMVGSQHTALMEAAKSFWTSLSEKPATPKSKSNSRSILPISQAEYIY